MTSVRSSEATNAIHARPNAAPAHVRKSNFTATASSTAMDTATGTSELSRYV